MTQNEIRNQELGRHEEKVDRNIERHQAVNLAEKTRGIQAANQNSSVARIINIAYFLFGALELLLLLRVILHLVGRTQRTASPILSMRFHRPSWRCSALCCKTRH